MNRTSGTPRDHEGKGGVHRDMKRILLASLAAIPLLAGCSAQTDSASAGAPAAGESRAPAAANDGAAPSPQKSSGGFVLASTAPRMVVKKAEMTVRVEDVAAAVQNVNQLATANGGYVESSNRQGNETTLPRATISLKVAAPKFDSAMNALRALGVVRSEVSSGEDVTAQYADVVARIKVMEAEEQSYLGMLRKAQNLGEVMELKTRIAEIRQIVEGQRAQAASLKNLASLSSIKVHLEQKEALKGVDPQDNWADAAWTTSRNQLRAGGQAIGSVAISLFVLSPFWLPALFLIVWLLRRALRQTLNLKPAGPLPPIVHE